MVLRKEIKKKGGGGGCSIEIKTIDVAKTKKTRALSIGRKHATAIKSNDEEKQEIRHSDWWHRS